MRTSDLVIAEAVQEAQDGTATLRFADVTAVAGRTVTVLLDGVSVPDVPCVGSYIDPQIGDRAWLLFQGTTLVAVGSNTLTGVGTAPVFAYVHDQVGTASTWTVTHNLGWKPNVQAFDSGGSQVYGAIVHVSDLELTITFTAGGSPVAFSGHAYLS